MQTNSEFIMVIIMNGRKKAAHVGPQMYTPELVTMAIEMDMYAKLTIS